MLADLDDADAVRGDLLVDLGLRPRRGRAGRVQVARQDVLEVHREQAAARVARRPLAGAAEAVVGDRVVLVAGAQVHVGVGAVVEVRGHAGRDRVAGAEQRARAVARRHGEDVGEALGHGLEAELELARGLRRARREERDAAEQRHAGRADTALQQAAA